MICLQAFIMDYSQATKGHVVYVHFFISVLLFLNLMRGGLNMTGQWLGDQIIWTYIIHSSSFQNTHKKKRYKWDTSVDSLENLAVKSCYSWKNQPPMAVLGKGNLGYKRPLMFLRRCVRQFFLKSLMGNEKTNNHRQI